MADKDWKHHLLRSGLPFEYEVKECFANQNCTVWDEYSYIKSDENNLDKEFSYDIDANYWNMQGNASFTFMAECKYKTEPTKWFFLPDPFAGQSDLHPNSFLHTVDHFTDKKFLFNRSPYDKIQDPLGPFCLKGVEVYQNQFLETNIYKAINQLAYAFVEKVISSIQNQLDVEHFYDTKFFNIPVIITNAELYIIHEKIKTSDIEKAGKIEEVSSRHDFLLFHNKIGESLRRHNQHELSSYFASVDKELFETRNRSFAKELPHLIDVLSRQECPEVILIMHHDKEHKNYQKLFDYINFIIRPSTELDEATKKAREDWVSQMKEFEEKLPGFKAGNS